MFSTRALHQPWVAPCATGVVVLVMSAAFVAPIANIGFVGDDIYRSSIPAYANASHQSIASSLGAVARSTDQAALAPLQAIALGIWFLRPTEATARCLQYGLLLINVLTCALVAARLFAARTAGLLATVCLFATLQIRFGNDPILGQTATSTIGCEILLLALLALAHYLERPTRSRLIPMLCAFSMALLSDPSAIALVVVFPAVFALQAAWSLGKRTLYCLTFAALGAAISAIEQILMSRGFTTPSIGAVIGQIVAALPLVYRTFHAMVSGGFSPGGVPPDQRFLGVPGAGAAGLVLACGGTAAACLALRYYEPRSHRAGILYGAVAGAGLWLIPAVLAANSASTITLPLSTIYVQSFGVAFLLTAVLAEASRRAVGSISAPAMMLLLFVGLTILGNAAQAQLVAQSDGSTSEVRSMLEDAGTSGMFQAIPNNSTIALDSKVYPFRFDQDWRNAKYLLMLYSGRRYEATPIASLGRAPGKGAIWILRYDRADSGHPRQIALGRYAGGGARQPLVDQTVAFQVFETSEQRSDELSHFNVGGRGMVASTSALGSLSALVTVERTCGPVEDRFAMLPSAPTIGFGRGFLPDLNYIPAEIILIADTPYYIPTGHVWRFMGPSGDLTVKRDSCGQSPLVLTMTVASAEPALARVSSGGRSALYPVSQFPSTVSFLIPDDGEQTARVRIQTNGRSARLYDWAPRRQHVDFAPDARLFVTKPEARYL